MLKLAVIMDPIESINFHKDSTFAILKAAQARNIELYYLQQHQMYLADSKVMASVQRLEVFDDEHQWFALGVAKIQDLSEMDILLQRKDPPFNMAYIYTTYLLEKLDAQGVLVCNRPQSIRDYNEKLFATDFPQCTPDTIVSSQYDVLRAFLAKHKDIILKPLDGMGGTAIFRVQEKDPNVNVIMETLTDHQQRLIMAQCYIPEILQGDKRILLINGKPVPFALARIPAENETRANLAVGGRGVVQALSERDLWICGQVAPKLIEKGLYFVGLDVIGDYLTEINVTSPTGIRQIDKAQSIEIGGMLIDELIHLCHH